MHCKLATLIDTCDAHTHTHTQTEAEAPKQTKGSNENTAAGSGTSIRQKRNVKNAFKAVSEIKNKQICMHSNSNNNSRNNNNSNNNNRKQSKRQKRTLSSCCSILKGFHAGHLQYLFLTLKAIFEKVVDQSIYLFSLSPSLCLSLLLPLPLLLATFLALR